MSPRNACETVAADGVGKASLHGVAPYVTMYVQVREDRIERVTFQTFGCGYSIATCSALTELATGCSRTDAMQMSAKTLLNYLDGVPPEKEFCAEMAVRALREAINNASSLDPN